MKPSPLRWLLVLAIVAAAIWVSRAPDAALDRDRASAAVIWSGDCAGCPTPGAQTTGCAEDCVFCPRTPAVERQRTPVERQRTPVEQPKPPAQAPVPDPAPQPEAPKPATPRKTT